MYSWLSSIRWVRLNYFWMNNKVVRCLFTVLSDRIVSPWVSQPCLYKPKYNVWWYLVIVGLWLLFEDTSSFTSGSEFVHVGEGANMSRDCMGFGDIVVVSVVGVWEGVVLERVSSSSGFISCCPSVDGGDGWDDRVDGVSSCSLSCLCWINLTVWGLGEAQSFLWHSALVFWWSISLSSGETDSTRRSKDRDLCFLLGNGEGFYQRQNKDNKKKWHTEWLLKRDKIHWSYNLTSESWPDEGLQIKSLSSDGVSRSSCRTFCRWHKTSLALCSARPSSQKIHTHAHSMLSEIRQQTIPFLVAGVFPLMYILRIPSPRQGKVQFESFISENAWSCMFIFCISIFFLWIKGLTFEH